MGLLPFFHIYGMCVIMTSGLCRGAKIVTLPKFEPQIYASVLKKHKVKGEFVKRGTSEGLVLLVAGGAVVIFELFLGVVIFVFLLAVLLSLRFFYT